MDEIERLYTDGGVLGSNPSARGGTWAWVQVSCGERVQRGYGWVTPRELAAWSQDGEMGREVVTNNMTELLAAVLGMEELPDGWGGELVTDSHVTLTRVVRLRKQAKLNGIPLSLQRRLADCKARLGPYRVSPEPAICPVPIACGSTRDGVPVSIHNVYVDCLCARAAREFYVVPFFDADAACDRAILRAE